jgi:hypothetical protein
MSTSYAGKGIDRAIPFKTLAELQAIRALGYNFVGRYLTKSRWKALTKQEAELITKADMYVASVYQNANNRADYFSYNQGKMDAYDAIEKAQACGAPDDAVLYFAVDFDTTKIINGVEAINYVYPYFKGVADVFASGYTCDKGFKHEYKYRLGVYGSYNTCIKVPARVPKVTFKWQTIAWSKGRECDWNMYQHAIDTVIPENKKLSGYDLNRSKGNAGAWKVKM